MLEKCNKQKYAGEVEFVMLPWRCAWQYGSHNYSKSTWHSSLQS